MKEEEQFLFKISVYSVLVPLIVGLVLLKKLDATSRVMVILVACAAVPQIASLYELIKLPYFYNSYTIVDAAIWGYLFYKNSKNSVIRSSIILIISLQAIVSIYVFSTAGISTRFYSEFVCLTSLLQSLWVLSFFYERYKHEEILALEKEPMFWFCLGILIYAPTSYFRFVYIDEILETDYAILIIHHVLNTCMYLLFSVGMLTNVFRASNYRNVFIRYKS